MKSFLTQLAAALALCGLTACAATGDSPTTKTNMPTASHFQFKPAAARDVKYLVYLPEGYDKDSGKKWPLMLFLHGAGERGTDVQRVGIHGPMKLVKQGKQFPFIIVAPLCPEHEYWSPDVLLQLLDHVMAEYAVDTHRVYLTGLSMGGYGTWGLGLMHPEKFAAIAPICGGGAAIGPILSSREKPQEFKSLGIWAFHGAKDTTVPVEESENLVKIIKKLGATDVQLTIYPEAQHDSWTATYNNPEFYEWLLKHHRD